MTITSGIVLCGGRSVRMGRGKAWLPWNGRPILCHVVDRLAEVVDEVWVVAAPGQRLPELAAGVVTDREPGLGPLAGIREGLAAARGDVAFVTATDAPFLTAAFVEAVLRGALHDVLRGRGAAAPVVDGIVQSLAAAYPTEAVAVAGRLLRTGRRRPLDLLEALDYAPLPASSLPDLPTAVRGFNTPDAYLAALAESPAADAAPVTLELTGRARAEVGAAEIRARTGRLRDVLAPVDARVCVLAGDGLAPGWIVSLGASGLPITSLDAPIGPGERVILHWSAGEGRAVAGDGCRG